MVGLPFAHTRRLVLAVVAAAGCVGNYDIPVSQLPDALQPIPGAKKVVSAGDGDVFSVYYELAEPYPASEMLAAIDNRIPSEWAPRSEDSLNPGIPTSHVRGWTSYGDRTSSPHSWVHSWSAEWESPEGDILSYHLVYRSPSPRAVRVEAPTTDKLQIMASISPHWQIEEVRDLISRGKR